MTIWTVFEPEGADETGDTRLWADGVVLVPERLSWSSILFAPLVLLGHRLWLGLIAYALVQALVALALFWLDLRDEAVVLFLLPNIAVALALPGLRRLKLGWHGYEEVGAVAASTLEAAEQRYFDARLGAPSGRSTVGVPALRPAVPARSAESRVLGLFPEAGR